MLRFSCRPDGWIPSWMPLFERRYSLETVRKQFEGLHFRKVQAILPAHVALLRDREREMEEENEGSSSRRTKPEPKKAYREALRSRKLTRPTLP